VRVLYSVLICGYLLISVPVKAQDRTASLTGKVTDITGALVAGTLAELRSESAPERGYRTTADSAGAYHFSTLPADEYTLKLSMPGFRSLTVKSIHISESEQKWVPTVQLAVSINGCRDRGVLDYIRFLQLVADIGNLGGSVRLDKGPMVGQSPLVAGADVTLICSTGKICGATKTDSSGGFLFKALRPGIYSVRVNNAGFYPLNKPEYEVAKGIESIYWSVYIERCPLGNCDPWLRPEKPAAVCE
jgi:carboxypeptidase family protein